MTLTESKVTFLEGPHIYQNEDGSILISVTELLKKYGLSKDYSMIKPEVLAAAAARGTAVHSIIEQYDNGIDPDYGDYGMDLATYMSLKNDKGFEVDRSEYRVNNDFLAGSVDKVFSDGSLADIKTCSVIDEDGTMSYRWQLSIYSYLCRKMNPGMDIPHLYIIWVRDTKGKVIEVPAIPDDEIEHLFEHERMHLDPETYEFIRTYSISDEIPTASRMKLQEYIAIQKKIAELKTIEKQLDEKAKELGLLDEFMSGVIPSSVTIDGWRINLMPESPRITVDSAKLKAQYPDIWAEVVKTGVTSAFLKAALIKK